MKTAPLLSIGMIFKNEKRCLERCLKSLQPLRNAIPCELVMADTGAEDGSREIAERYADEVFDFPWINDFSAARNAVMDRCSGKWYFSVDSDEWLDEDISELLDFLKRGPTDFGFVVQRNYATVKLEKGDSYGDFRALRLLRMSTGRRFQGAIHESFGYREPAERLTHTILHHDGYVYTSLEEKKKKAQRNMKLLRQKLEQDPENLCTLLQCIESGKYTPDYLQYIRRGVAAVQAKNSDWEAYGPCILRHAVEAARTNELPEREEWAEYAEKQFPDSIFTLIDLYYSEFLTAHTAKQWEKVIRYVEGYRKGLQRLYAARKSRKTEEELGHSALLFSCQSVERYALIGFADALLHTGQGEKALKLLAGLVGETLSPEQVKMAAITFCNLHALTQLDISDALTSFYEQIGQNAPSEVERRARLAVFDSVCAGTFTESYQKEEQAQEGYRRPAFTVLRSLAGKCEAGRAAAILMTNDPVEMHKWLLAVEDWQALPIEALEYALQAGVTFPLKEKPLSIEVLDGLAAKLPRGEHMARQLVMNLPENVEQYPDLQNLFWAKALTLTTLRSFKWDLFAKCKQASRILSDEPVGDDPNEQTPEEYTREGFTLLRRFARVEDNLLPLLYAPGMLCEENAALLPPMHRWGLYCSRALHALDGGNPQDYLALLRKGLKACPGEKDMVQFMLDRFVETTRPKTSPELLALAERVRTILAAYSPNDPAVAALKASPAYQKVAWIIEEPNAGGLPS